jgi:hypothetical protein
MNVFISADQYLELEKALGANVCYVKAKKFGIWYWGLRLQSPKPLSFFRSDNIPFLIKLFWRF